MSTPAGLVKVRGARRGAGWKIGLTGVLTAEHVTGGAPGTPCLVVPQAVPGADTFDATVTWSDPDRDLSILTITDTDRWKQLDTQHAPTVLAEVGTEPIDAIAIGFPDAALVSGFPSPSTVIGSLLPAEHFVASRMPLDARTATPDQPTAWAGMSGAAVRDTSGRLLGIVTQASTAHQNRRLLVSPLPPAPPDSTLSAALAAVGASPVIEDARAIAARELLTEVTDAGRPPRIGDLPLHAFGVRRARTDINLHGDDYFPYIPRHVDAALDQALARRADGSDPRPILVVGESMAGSSRSVCEAVRRQPPWNHANFLRPRTPHKVHHVLATWPERPAVLWLDSDTARTIDLPAVRAATGRGLLLTIMVLSANELRRLQEPPHIGDAWRILTDETLIEPLRVKPELHEHEEREALAATSIGKAVARHRYRLAEYLGAGQELLRRLKYAPTEGQALIDLAAEWALTGTPLNLEPGTTQSLWPHYYAAATGIELDDCDDDELRRELDTALDWATTRVAGTRSVLRRRRGALIVDSHILQRRAAHPNPHTTSDQQAATAQLWNEAIRQTLALPNPPAESLTYLAVAGAAHGADPQLQRDAIKQAASLRSGAACLLQGLYEMRTGDTAAARSWWETALNTSDNPSTPHVSAAHLMLGMTSPGLTPAQRQQHLEAAAQSGHAAAAAQLGVLLMKHDHPKALHWLEQAADQHGDDIALFLGILLTRNPDRLQEAEDWLRRAVTAGQDAADFYLAQLLAKNPARTQEAAELLAGSALLKDPHFQLALAAHPMFAEEADALRAHALAALGKEAYDDATRIPGAFSLPFDISLNSSIKHLVQNPAALLD